MRPKALFSVVLISIFMSGCGKAGSKVADGQEGQGTEVGPFELKLGTLSTATINRFSVPIRQDEGAVIFNLTEAQVVRNMLIKSVETKVTGCNSDNVKTNLWWFRSEESGGLITEVGLLVKNRANDKSFLRVEFLGLTGCTHIDFTLEVATVLEGELTEANPPADLFGSWYIGDTKTKWISLFIRNKELGWLDVDNSRTICDRYYAPKYSPISLGRGWFDVGYGTTLCQYQFLNLITRDKMEITCYGRHYGCSQVGGEIAVKR